jgi:hypothetical protein
VLRSAKIDLVVILSDMVYPPYSEFYRVFKGALWGTTTLKAIKVFFFPRFVQGQT